LPAFLVAQTGLARQKLADAAEFIFQVLALATFI
jgi:hypothetical protein